MHEIYIRQRANVLPYAFKPCKKWGFGISLQSKTPPTIYTFYTCPSVRVPIYAHDDNLAPKPIQDVGAVLDDKVQQQVVPEDDTAPVDGEVTVEPAPLLQRKRKGPLSIATSLYL